MARQRRVVWSPKAKKKRKEILQFWIHHNQSTTYSRKLNALFREKTDQLKMIAYIGRPTDHENIRIKRVSHFLIYYEITDETIDILNIWDSRDDPDRFQL